MTAELYIWKQDHRWFPEEDPVCHLDMPKLLAWSRATRDYWVANGPAPATFQWHQFPKLRISVETSRPVPDHFYCGSIGVVSEDLRNLLVETCGIGSVEFHDVTIVNTPTRNRKYFCYNVLNAEDPLDQCKSSIEYYDELCGGGISRIKSLVLSEQAFIRSNIFSLSIEPALNVVTSQLKSRIQNSRLTGSVFIPFERYSDVWMFENEDVFER
jgi:hypothetical protein